MQRLYIFPSFTGDRVDSIFITKAEYVGWCQAGTTLGRTIRSHLGQRSFRHYVLRRCSGCRHAHPRWNFVSHVSHWLNYAWGGCSRIRFWQCLVIERGWVQDPRWRSIWGDGGRSRRGCEWTRRWNWQAEIGGWGSAAGDFVPLNQLVCWQVRPIPNKQFFLQAPS